MNREKKKEIVGNSSLPTDFQKFIYISRYAKWLEKESRRETYEETVTRYINFMCDEQCKDKISTHEREELKRFILNLDVMPSMRALMTAGKAVARDNCAAYNCAYLAINRVRAFAEVLYILMCGTGVGFSVERQEINKLPEIPDEIFPTETTIVFSDSRIGWATGLDELLNLLYTGKEPKIDFSKLRVAGARLKTFGGRSSGPEPLKELCKFIIHKFKNAVSRKLTSLEVHDIVCKIAEVVIVGGVRRSALISLSNLSDDRMRQAKSGDWYNTDPQRTLSNNSACYTEKPEVGIFLKEFLSLYESKSGERGIFNRKAALKQAIKNGRRKEYDSFGSNPCNEILLKDRQFCNLTEVVIKSTDTISILKNKIKVATILGTMQSTFTAFRFLSKQWKINCEEEALLGVSFTGIMDHSVMSSYFNEEDLNNFLEGNKNHNAYKRSNNLEKLSTILEELREYAILINKQWSKKLGINQSVAITCVKPSGTVSQLVNSSSGIHSRFSQFYIRTVRVDKKDPLYQFMVEYKIPHEDDVIHPDSVSVFSFPIEAPKNCITTKDRTALEQLELWLIYHDFYCEHKPSITIYVKENEWIEVAAWVYKNFDKISGISFLPHTGHVYRQAPYQEITKEEYDSLLKNMPENINWTDLQKFEKEDTTRASKEYACSGNSCELIDLVK